MNDTGIIVLAAGKASRFGEVKQLAHYNGKTLIQHVTEEALAAQMHPVIVVTGSNAERVAADITQPSVNVVYNENWQQGMASGIVAGVSFVLSSYPGLQRIILAVCDQPFVSSQLFQQLIEKSKEGNAIVACAYADTLGTPVLFTQPYFTELLQLKGEEGAKQILKHHRKEVTSVDFPQGNIDIDTPEDYHRLQSNQRHIL